MRGPKRGYNVIVYYVDTLRNDVARDPKVMPNLARFAERSLDFRSAYAAGSDTLRSLPALTGGNYDVSSTPDNDLLRVAKRADYDRVLVIAKSAPAARSCSRARAARRSVYGPRHVRRRACPSRFSPR